MSFTKSFSNPDHLIDTIQNGFLFAPNKIPIHPKTTSFIQNQGFDINICNNFIYINSICLTVADPIKFDDDTIQVFGNFRISMSEAWPQSSIFKTITYFSFSERSIESLHSLALASEDPSDFFKYIQPQEDSDEAEVRAVWPELNARLEFRFEDIEIITVPNESHLDQIKLALRTRFPSIAEETFPISVISYDVPELEDIDSLLFSDSID